MPEPHPPPATLPAPQDGERRYRLLFESHPTPMWVCDLDTLCFLDVNEAAVRHYGYSRDEFLALTIADIRPAAEQAPMRADVQAARADDCAPVFGAGIFRHRTKSGRLIDVEITRTVVDFDGRRAGLVAAVDVSARLAAEREREAAAARLRELMARVSDGFFALDRELRLSYVNERALPALGVAAAGEAIGRRFEALYGAADDAPEIVTLREALASGQPCVVEHQAPRSRRWFESRIYPSADGVSVFFTDVSERRRGLQELRTSEQRYRDLFELSPHPKFVRDALTQRLLAVNQAALDAHGYSREEMLALSLYDLVPAADLPQLRADVAHMHADRQAVFRPAAPRRHRRKDGSLFYVEIVSREMEFDGRAARLTVATVVTERLRAQTERDRALAALRERVERLRVFVAQAPVSLAMFDRGMHYIAASRHWHASFRLGEADLAGRHHHEVVPDMKPEWKEIERRGLAGEVVRCEADRFERADGSVQWLRWEVLPWLEPASGRIGGILIYSEDISQRVADEAALREAEAYQRSLFEAMGDGVLLLDRGLTILDANPKALAMLGLERSGLAAHRLPDFVHGQDAAEVDRTLAGLLVPGEGPARLAEWEQRRRDGSGFAAEVSARAVGDRRIVVVLRDISERRAAQRALMSHQVELSELTQRLLNQERETARHLAQTLHDQLGQSLTVARLRLDAAIARAGSALPADLHGEYRRVAEALDRAMADVRGVLGDLRPPMLEDQGLIAALDNEIRMRIQDAACVDVLLELDDGQFARRWPAEVEHAAFMIAREAIVNAQRHAGATLVRVIVEGDGARLVLDTPAAGGTRVHLHWPAARALAADGPGAAAASGAAGPFNGSV